MQREAQMQEQRRYMQGQSYPAYLHSPMFQSAAMARASVSTTGEASPSAKLKNPMQRKLQYRPKVARVWLFLPFDDLCIFGREVYLPAWRGEVVVGDLITWYNGALPKRHDFFQKRGQIEYPPREVMMVFS